VTHEIAAEWELPAHSAECGVLLNWRGNRGRHSYFKAGVSSQFRKDLSQLASHAIYDTRLGGIDFSDFFSAGG
jgi:hypothetical protein